MVKRTLETPGFIKPQLATLKAKAPVGPHWLHEIMFDGYRVQVHLNKGKRKVCTRNGLDWTKRFSVVADTLDMTGVWRERFEAETFSPRPIARPGRSKGGKQRRGSVVAGSITRRRNGRA
jgi:hypothetical protein